MKKPIILLILFASIIICQQVLCNFYLNRDHMKAKPYYEDALKVGGKILYVNEEAVEYEVVNSVLRFKKSTSDYAYYIYIGLTKTSDQNIILLPYNGVTEPFTQIDNASFAEHFTAYNMSDLKSLFTSQLTDSPDKPLIVLVTFAILLFLIATIFVVTIFFYRKKVLTVLQILFVEFALYVVLSFALMQDEISTFLGSAHMVAISFWLICLIIFTVANFNRIFKQSQEQLFP